MKSVKWFYVGAMAIALGMLTFATVACHDDDDDPKPLEGEVIETPKTDDEVSEEITEDDLNVEECDVCEEDNFEDNDFEDNDIEESESL